jgi:ankyrin repeat protein
LEAFRVSLLPNLARNTALVEARDDLSLVPGHDLVLNKAVGDLAIHIEANPVAVLTRDSYGFTLLHWAVLCANPETVTVLLEAGAEVNAVCKQGRSVLMYAVRSSFSARSCKVLLDWGADVNMTDPHGATALALALNVGSRSGQTCEGTVEVLLRAGTDIQRKNDSQLAILEEAVVTNASVGACRLLLDYGAVLDSENSNGWSAVAYAVRLNRHSVLELLVERGAALDTLADRGYSRLITFSAYTADVRTMQILTKARINGIPMDSEDRMWYWHDFGKRDKHFLGDRQSEEVERAAFQALLDSVIPLDPKQRPMQIPLSPIEEPHIPGAFPLEDSEDELETAFTFDDDGFVFSDDDEYPSSDDDDIFPTMDDGIRLPNDEEVILPSDDDIQTPLHTKGNTPSDTKDNKTATP